MGLALAAATAVLYATAATASPESDAAAAIDAAWNAAGGDASQLGPRDGGVYPAGAGFGQNFAGGAIFFSPATGARTMHGAILEKYRALGGPAESDLGFPKIDEGPGRVSPESRNSTFNAGDNPVIFWTPETGAWVVRGAINAAWDQVGGSSGILGVPIEDESYDGDVVTQRFTGGLLSFDTRTRTFTTEPPELAGQLADLNIPSDPASAIAAAWRANGGADGPLGARAGGPYPIGAGGTAQDFAGGKVFYTPETGAFAVTGDILAKYESAGGPAGDFGFPVASEADGGVPDSRVQAFSAPDNPVIFWTPDHGAVIVGGAMKAAWDELGGATGELGVPTGDQNTEGTTVTQQFSGGELAWNSADNTFSSDPANLAESLAGLEVPNAPVPSTPPAAPEPADEGGVTWQNWWLWWIIPLALLLLGSLYAWMAMSKRRSDRSEPDFDEDADDARYDTRYGEDARYGEDPHDGHEGHEDFRGESSRWSSRSDFAETDDDGYDDGGYDEGGNYGKGGYLAPPVWSEREAEPATTRFDELGDDGLFTHHGGVQDSGPAHLDDDFEEPIADEDPDAVDTAPTRVVGATDDQPEPSGGRHSAFGDESRRSWDAPEDDDYLPGPGSLFAPVYGAAPPPAPEYTDDVRFGAHAEAPAPPEPAEQDRDAGPPPDAGAPPAIHLPLDDPHRAPDGYPIKGSMRTGRYHVPGTPGYDETVAEIWFASPELAEANGFSRAD